jgi:arginase
MDCELKSNHSVGPILCLSFPKPLSHTHTRNSHSWHHTCIKYIGVLVTEQPHTKLYRYTAEPRTCTVIGAPMTYGQPYVGTDSGPALLRQNGLLKDLSALHWRVEDMPDLDFETAAQHSVRNATGEHSNFTGNAKNHWQVGAGTKLLAELLEQKLRDGRFPLVLGGDHSIGIGSLAGILKVKPDVGVLWIDAHADLNTPWISESGNMHGMPVGLMTLDLGGQTVPGLEWLQNYPRLPPNQLVYIGLRDVDPEERKLIRELNIKAFTMSDIDRYGIGHVMEMALDHLKDRPLHLSYDIDSVDPVIAPATGTSELSVFFWIVDSQDGIFLIDDYCSLSLHYLWAGTAVRGGLTFREAHFVAEAVASSGRLMSGEIVELNPTLSAKEGADNTVELGLQILTSLMGKSII